MSPRMRMNPEYEKQLEADVRRELNALGELSAPPALANRIMRAIEQRATAPWYRRAWQSWPLPARIVSFAALLAMFGGICFGVAGLLQSPEVSAAGSQAGEWFGWLAMIWKTVNVLASAAATTVRQLGAGFIFGCLALLLAAYAMCIGLGAACVRLAMAKQ